LHPSSPATAGVQSCILDCEVVAYDDVKGIMAFQMLQSRGKKAVKIEDVKVRHVARHTSHVTRHTSHGTLLR
jgi:ATP-dependent DNA ligase